MTDRPPEPSADRNWPRPLLLILAAGLVVRLLLWVWFAPVSPHITDEKDYITLARVLVETGEYAETPGGPPASMRPPLYPAVVAGVYRLAGVDNFQAVRLLQAVLSLGLVVIVYRLGRDVYSERAGLWAAGLFCFYPSFLGYNNLLLTEFLFTFWLVAGVWQLVRGLRRPSFAALAAAGVLLGLGALTRSILYPMAPVLAVFLAAAWRGSVPKRALAALAFLVPFAAVLAPWAVRNTRVQQTFIPVDTMGGRNFMMGNYEHTPLYRSWDAISIEGDRAWYTVLYDHRPETRAMTQGQRDKAALKEGIEFVKAHPELTAGRDAIKFSDFWGLERELVAGAAQGFFGPIPRPAVLLLGALICGAYVAVLFAGVFGAAVAPPADRRVHLLFLLVIALICGAHTVVFAHSRYHLPVMPFVMVYAAGAATGPGVWSRRTTVGFWIAALFCAGVAAGWAWNAAAGDLDKLTRVIGPG